MKISLLFIIMTISAITATEDARRFRGYMGAQNLGLPLIRNGRFNTPTYRSPYQAMSEYGSSYQAWLKYRSSYPAMTVKCILYGITQYCFNHNELS